MNRKGQAKGAGGAAIFVLLLAVFILLYMIFISPAEREKLLNQDGEEGNKTTTKSEKRVLLEASPGEIIANLDGSIKHEMLPVLLFLKNEPDVQSLATNLKIEKGLIGSRDHTLTFIVEDLSNLKESSLFLYVQDSKGDLRIELNGNIIFDQEINPQKLERIILPKDKLLEGDNQLKLSVNRGILSANKYELQNIEIRNNYEVQNREEQSTVNLDLPLREAELSYNLFCKTDTVITTLTIYINNKEQFKGIVPCTSVQTMEVDPEVLVNGANEIAFEIDRGEYQISNIVLNTKSERPRGWSSTFLVSSKVWDDIQAEDVEVTLNLELSGKKRKIADI